MTVSHHPLHLRDRAAMLAMRGLLALQAAPSLGPEGRQAADEMLARTPAAADVAYEAAVVGGIAGWWCRPADTQRDRVMLYLHGGAYVVGSAAAYRNFVGQICARAGITAFVADYALAPERPFPAAFDDALAAFDGLIEGGAKEVLLAGDSAGGGLALALLAAVSDESRGRPKPTCAIAMSPWIDLALEGDSVVSRARVDPLLTREALATAAALYLGDHDPHDPRVSALSASTSGLPPVLIHVGDDEILLDDAARYAAAVEKAGGEIELHIWDGMVHVFPANIATLRAATEALDLIASFPRTRAVSGDALSRP